MVRQKWRTVAWMSTLNLPVWGVDVLAAQGRVPWDTLAIRVGWMLLTVVVAWGLWRLRPNYQGSLRWFITGLLLPNVCLGLICWRLGGTQNPVFGWFCAVP